MKLRHISLYNVLMCFSVVIIHLTSNPVLYLRHDSVWYFLFFVVNKFFTFAVPAFIFLSGFKLFNKYKNSHIDLKKFYLGRFKKIVIPYLIAFFIYFFFYKVQNLTQWNDLIPGLFLGTLVAHFYYIIIAIQLYFVFPALNYLFKKYDHLLLVFSFVCTIVLNQFTFFAYSDRFFATYLFYFVLGMFIAKYKADVRIKPTWLYLTIFLPLSITHIYLSYKMSLGDFWYKISGAGQALYAIFAIILMYNLCMKIDGKRINKFVNFVDPYTFYIFLYHILIINIMQFVVYPHFNLSIKYQFLITSIVIVGTIFAYCWLMHYIKTRKT